ncbi:hypothetical protein [Rhizobium leucaenae]|uniref:Uncharacterized protein n=1 Tax=Rhizobium leucaenae TaxID=29450 RepID=A0A7W7EIV9_9HYPH|nr:hypothetical protein [Rhizobium leucaenae]MBB4566804.1 hypothetical protein [Rhizobium leucaenae]MBB6300612.1 hypothetical protein [Rhizobium leucaenae]
MSPIFRRRRQPPKTEPDYETRDVSPRIVLLWTSALFIGVGLSVLVAFGILRWVEPSVRFALGSSQTQERNGPRLEVSPSADRYALQREAESRLQGYGWTDRATQTAHIPIERAMALLAARGWPDQDKGEAAK